MSRCLSKVVYVLSSVEVSQSCSGGDATEPRNTGAAVKRQSDYTLAASFVTFERRQDSIRIPKSNLQGIFAVAHRRWQIIVQGWAQNAPDVRAA